LIAYVLPAYDGNKLIKVNYY